MRNNFFIFYFIPFLLLFLACDDNEDNREPPIIHFINPFPYSGSTICRIVNMEVQAEATQGKTIARVEFFVDGVLQSDLTDLTAPYSCVWEAKDKFGELRTLSAKAIDNIGASAADSVQVKIWNGIEKSAMPTARYNFTANSVNGKVYVIGGYDKANKVVEEFDPVTNTWSIKASPNKGHAAHASCVIDNKIYVFGGDEGFNWIPDSEVYHPASNSWSSIKSIPASDSIGIGLMSCAAQNGKAYLFGGLSTIPNFVKVGEYDPVNNTWTKKSTKNIFFPAAVSVNNKLYVLGGCPFQSIGMCPTPANTLEIYDPLTGVWETKPAMPDGRSAVAAITLNGKIYVFGGVGNNSSSITSYDPATAQWKVLVPMPQPAGNVACAEVNGKVYLIGAKVYEYTPE